MEHLKDGCYKVRHKKEGWTGRLYIDDMYMSEGGTGSHTFCGTVTQTFTLHQDCHKEDGSYVEDPRIESLDELEILGVYKYDGKSSCQLCRANGKP